MSYLAMEKSIEEKYNAGEITLMEMNRLYEELDSHYALENIYEKFGVIPVDDDTVVYESIKADIGKFLRDKVDLKAIKKKWNDVAKNFEHKWKKIILQDERQSKDLKDSYEVLKRPQLNFMEYKKHFVKIARASQLPSDEIILENVVFGTDEETGKEKMSVRYSKGKQQIVIPNGTCLVHVSPVEHITELKPAFRSKTVGKYMYPSPRCFFTLGKVIAPTKAGLEKKTVYKYTPVEDVRAAYIDPSYTDYKTGSVYIESSFPIKVMDYDKKMKKIFEIRQMANENVQDYVNKFRQLILESQKDMLITTEQAIDLFNILK